MSYQIRQIRQIRIPQNTKHSRGLVIQKTRMAKRAPSAVARVTGNFRWSLLPKHCREKPALKRSPKTLSGKTPTKASVFNGVDPQGISCTK